MRGRNKGLTKYHIAAIPDFSGTSQQQSAVQSTESRKNRCYICPSKMSRDSKQCCDKYNLNVCFEHSTKKIIWVNCFPK